MKKITLLLIHCLLLYLACHTSQSTASKSDSLLEGEFVYMADVALFYVCVQQKQYPVKGNAAYLEMERAYLNLRDMQPGQKVFTQLEGHFEDGPKTEGEGTESYIIVDRFHRFLQGRQCQ